MGARRRILPATPPRRQRSGSTIAAPQKGVKRSNEAQQTADKENKLRQRLPQVATARLWPVDFMGLSRMTPHEANAKYEGFSSYWSKTECARSCVCARSNGLPTALVDLWQRYSAIFLFSPNQYALLMIE